MNESKSDTLLGKVAEKMKHIYGDRRMDLTVEDFLPLSRDSAKILVAYSARIGPPSPKDISKFMVEDFHGQIAPVLETLRYHEKVGAVTVVVDKLRPILAFEARENMVKLHENMYTDTRLGEVWEVIYDDKTKSKHLARKNPESLENILNERKARLSSQGTPRTATVRFSDLVLTACSHSAESGDKVLFFDVDKLYKGTILSRAKEDVTVVDSDGAKHVVNKYAIVDVLEKSTEAKEDEKRDLRSYFEQAYGFKMYADDLVNQKRPRKESIK